MSERAFKVILLTFAFFTWVAVCLFAVGPAKYLLDAVATVAGNTRLSSDLAAGLVAEGLVYLAASWAVFGLLRLAKPPKWYWAAGPVGYLLSEAAFFAMTWVVGREMTTQKGYVVKLAVDLAAVVVGSLLGAFAQRARDGAADTGDADVEQAGQ